jgi:tetratricopeptide (TPR) repeat protein
LFAINPSLGNARDWDLFATSAALLGCTILVFYFRKYTLAIQNRNMLPASLATVFVTLWVLTNSAPARQLQRAEDLLDLSDQARGYCTELLAHYYRYEARDDHKVLELLGSITGPARNARVLRQMSLALYTLEDYPKALSISREGLAQDSLSAEMNYVAGQSLMELGFADSANIYLRRAQQADSRNYVFTRSLARNFYALGRIEDAIAGYKHALELDPEKSIGYFDIAVIYLRSGQLDSAYFYVQSGLKIDPDYQPGYGIMNAIKTAAGNTINPTPAQP